MLPIRHIPGLHDYMPIWSAMQQFTNQRLIARETHGDQVWMLEHTPVFTQGVAGKPEHVLNPHGIPVVQCDRGGQVTYHGPGQLMAYTLIDLNQRGISTRDYVRKLEQCVIRYLGSLGIPATHDVDAPGVYVDGAKICSIGLRVRQGLVYHGLAFNVAMDITPFSYINPCGYQALRITQLSDFCTVSMGAVREAISHMLSTELGYNQWHLTTATLQELV